MSINYLISTRGGVKNVAQMFLIHLAVYRLVFFLLQKLWLRHPNQQLAQNSSDI